MDEVIEAQTTKKDQLAIVEEMIKRLDDMPQHAMMQPINHYDYYSLLVLMQALLKMP